MIFEKLKYRHRAFRYRYRVDVNEIDYAIRNLKEGDVCVDLGCHKGGYLYWFRKSVGETGKVYAFEPQLKLYNYLEQISDLFNYHNVVIENKGVSAQEGKAKFYIPATSNGTSPGARLDLIEKEEKYESVEIELTTLDKYFLENSIYPKLIKIDVEGHEKQVLQGGMELLKSCRPKIVMECEQRHLDKGEDICDVFEMLTDIGYNGYFFEANKLRPINEFNKEKHQMIDSGDFWNKKGYLNNFIFDTIEIS